MTQAQTDFQWMFTTQILSLSLRRIVYHLIQTSGGVLYSAEPYFVHLLPSVPVSRTSALQNDNCLNS